MGLWLILFMFFAILFVEVFALTKWGSGETQDQNYRSMASALVMLAFMSTGYVPSFVLTRSRLTEEQRRMESIHARLVRLLQSARLAINFRVHSMLSYPRCTNPTKDDPDSDCGSVGWAFLLFISWNLLSMVRFYLFPVPLR